MSAEPIATVEQSLVELVELLRSAGFPIGASEAIDATALVLALSEDAPDLASRAQLRTRLRPIFCKSREQQDAFDAIFERWAAAGPSPQPLRAAREANEPRVTTAAVAPTTNRRRRWILIAAGGAAIVAIAVGYQRWSQTQMATTPPVVEKTPAIPKRGPTPVRIEPESPSAGPVADRFLPAVRFNVEIYPAWVWLLGALPLAALFGISLPVLVLSRTRVRRRSEPMFLDAAPLTHEARRLVPELSLEITDRLARHVRSRGIDINRLARRPTIDVRRTIEATIRNRGIPSVRFSVSRIHPSYLLLVDVANERDPRGRLFFQWAERLQREGLAVELVQLRRTAADDGGDGAIQISSTPFGTRGVTAWAALRTLRPAGFGERLMVVTDGDPLVDADGRWRDEASRACFSRWRDRAIFTPIELRDWSVREESLERRERSADPGFIVLPLEESALGAWIDLVQTGRLTTVTLSDPQRYPALLRRGGSQRFVGDEPPDPATVERLMQQLRLYLGEQGFYWLAAIAVTPVVRWELTLLVGKAALGALPALEKERLLNEALARNYRRIVRLPWLRQETMPDWLRLRLLLELSQTRQRELRVVIERLLARLSPRAVTDGIELGFERPPGGAVDARVALREPPRGASGDALYLGYMSGLSPEQLVLRAPKEWQAWRNRIAPRTGVWRRWRERARAFLGRWAWAGGLPHLGFNRWRAAIALLLWLPLLGALTALASSAPSAPLSPESWFFVDRVHPLVMPVQSPRAVEFTLDGRRVATRSSDGTTLAWDARTGVLLDPPPADLVLGELATSLDTESEKQTSVPASLLARNDLVSFAVSVDGRRIASGGTDGVLHLWDAYTGAALGQPLLGHDGPVRAVAFSRDDRRLASVSDDNTLRLWDADPVAPLQTSSPANAAARTVTLSLPAKAGAVAFEPDSTAVLVATDDGSLLRWVVAAGEPTSWNRDNAGKTIIALHVAENMTLSLAAEGTLTQDIGGKRTISALPARLPPVAAAAFTSTLDLVIGHANGSGEWFPRSVVDAAVRTLPLVSLRITAMAATMRAFVVGDVDGMLTVWNPETGANTAAESMGNEAVTALAVSRDGGTLASATGRTLHITNLALQPIGSSMELSATIDALAFDWSGQYLAIAMSERRPDISSNKPAPVNQRSYESLGSVPALEDRFLQRADQLRLRAQQAASTASAPDVIRNPRVEIWGLAPTSASPSRRLVTETNQAALASVQSLTGWRPLWWVFGLTAALCVTAVLVNRRRVTRVLAGEGRAS
jgi:WD40 repeat protein